MSAKTGIEWTDATWNPIRGCSRVSPGCQNCYAEVVAARFSGPGQPYEGLARRRSNGEPQWTGEVRVIEKHMLDPIRWQKPRKIFVNSMSDLFHENVTDDTIDRVFAVMALAPRHTFQILTKRPQRMQRYVGDLAYGQCASCSDYRTSCKVSGHPSPAMERVFRYIGEINADHTAKRVSPGVVWTATPPNPTYPLPNVWLGVSVENQEAANERVPLLVQTPAAVRFLSCEPLLGPIDFEECGSLGPEVGDPFAFSALRGTDGTDPAIPGIDWVIVGGESGPRAREFDLSWARNIVAHCANSDVPVFVKQMGSNPIDPWCDTGALVYDREPARPAFRDSHGGDIDEWPSDLRVRQFPAVRA